MTLRAVGRLVQQTVHGVTFPIEALLKHVSLWVGEHQEIYGFDVVNLEKSAFKEALFKRLADVFELMLRHDSSTFARMRRNVKRIVIAPEGGPEGSYWPTVHACVIDSNHLKRDSVASVAMTLVHEATHARLHRAGFRYHPAWRDRIEMICLRAEIAFGTKLSGVERELAEARRAHKTRWWDPDSRRNRHERQLKALGCPNWLIRIRSLLLRD